MKLCPKMSGDHGLFLMQQIDPYRLRLCPGGINTKRADCKIA